MWSLANITLKMKGFQKPFVKFWTSQEINRLFTVVLCLYFKMRLMQSVSCDIYSYVHDNVNQTHFHINGFQKRAQKRWAMHQQAWDLSIEDFFQKRVARRNVFFFFTVIVNDCKNVAYLKLLINDVLHEKVHKDKTNKKFEKRQTSFSTKHSPSRWLNSIYI